MSNFRAKNASKSSRTPMCVRLAFKIESDQVAVQGVRLLIEGHVPQGTRSRVDGLTQEHNTFVLRCVPGTRGTIEGEGRTADSQPPTTSTFMHCSVSPLRSSISASIDGCAVPSFCGYEYLHERKAKRDKPRRFASVQRALLSSHL